MKNFQRNTHTHNFLGNFILNENFPVPITKYFSFGFVQIEMGLNLKMFLFILAVSFYSKLLSSPQYIST